MRGWRKTLVKFWMKTDVELFLAIWAKVSWYMLFLNADSPWHTCLYLENINENNFAVDNNRTELYWMLTRNHGWFLIWKRYLPSVKFLGGRIFATVYASSKKIISSKRLISGNRRRPYNRKYSFYHGSPGDWNHMKDRKKLNFGRCLPGRGKYKIITSVYLLFWFLYLKKEQKSMEKYVSLQQ